MPILRALCASHGTRKNSSKDYATEKGACTKQHTPHASSTQSAPHVVILYFSYSQYSGPHEATPVQVRKVLVIRTLTTQGRVISIISCSSPYTYTPAGLLFSYRCRHPEGKSSLLRADSLETCPSCDSLYSLILPVLMTQCILAYLLCFIFDLSSDEG
jgi:hypothetical protein